MSLPRGAAILKNPWPAFFLCALCLALLSIPEPTVAALGLARFRDWARPILGLVFLSLMGGLLVALPYWTIKTGARFLKRRRGQGKE